MAQAFWNTWTGNAGRMPASEGRAGCIRARGRPRRPGARAAGAGQPGWQAGREYGEMMPSAGLEERLTHVVTQS
jgi:hypothetical protein